MKKAIGILAGLMALAAIQGVVASAQILLANSLQTVAGTGMAGYSGDGKTASGSSLNLPSGVAVDSGRNVFIADTGNSVVRRIDAVTGTISTIAGIGHSGISVDGTAAISASLNAPGSVAVDSYGDVFIADTGNNRVVVVFQGGPKAAALITAENSSVTSPTIGAVYTIAGNATAGFSGDGANAYNCQLNAPAHVALDSQGDIYIADTQNQRVRAVYAGGTAAMNFITAANSSVITPSIGSVYTVAGTGTASSTGDGALAGSATLNLPTAVTVDLQNNLYISEKNGNRVRVIFLGSTPLANLIALESSGTTAKVGYIYTLAGTGTAGFSGDGSLASAANLNQPTGVVVDSASNVYVADSANGTIRQIIAATGDITTYAGSNSLGRGFSGDGGLATQGQFETPADIALDSTSGSLYVADSTGGQRVRAVSNGLPFAATSVGSISTSQNILLQLVSSDTLTSIAIVPSATSAASTVSTAEYALGKVTNCPADGVTVIPAGTICSVPISFSPQLPGSRQSPLVITDVSGTQFSFVLNGVGLGVLASIIPGEMTTIAGTGSATYKGDGGPAGAASLSFPYNVVVDSAGNVFINDERNFRIRVIYGGGQSVGHLITLENPSVLSPIVGDIYTIAGNGSSSSTYATGGLASSTPLSSGITGLAVDGADNVYIDDQSSERVVMVSSATGRLSTVAGVTGSVTSTPSSGDYGPATSASLYLSYVIAVDSFGNLYIGNGNNQIRKVSSTTGIITTVAGVGGVIGTGTTLDNGPALLAKFSSLQALYVDPYQNIYVGDPANRRVAIIYSGGSSNPAANLILATHSTLSTPLAGYIYTVAGNGTAGYTGNGGLATQADLGFFNQIAVDAAGDIYIGDRTSNYVRKVDGTTGIIRTIAGTGKAAVTGDGGVATSAAVNSPYGLGIDSLGNVYVADSSNERIREITAAGYPLSFALTTVGSSSAAQSVYLSNIGSASFLPTTIVTTPGFITTSSTTCAPSTTILPGSDCLAAVAFAPQVNGTTNGTLTFTGSGINASLALTGTGSGGVTTATAVTAPSSVVYGQLVTLNAAVTVAGSAVTSGTVVFSTGSTVLGSAQLSSSGVASTSLTSLAAGSYQITATFQQTGVNMSSSATTAITVSPAALLVTANNQSMQYGATVPTLTYSVTGFVNGDTAATALTGAPVVSTTATSHTDTGTYPILITQGTLSAANYTLGFANGVLTISGNVSQSIAFGSIPNSTYGIAPFTVSPIASSGLPVTLMVVSGPATVSGYTVTIKGAGAVILQATQVGNQDYAAATPVQQTFIVAKAALSVVVKNSTRLYGAADPTFTSTINGLVNGDTIGGTLTVAYQSSDTVSSSVGAYVIQATISGPAAASYTVSTVPGTLTVTPAPLTLTIANASRLYGSQNPTFTASLTGLLNGDSPSTDLAEQLSTIATVSSPVGTYAINGSVSGSASGNYSTVVLPGVLSISPAALSATAASASRMYGQPNPSFSGTYSGALNGDVFTETFTTTATQSTNAGNYPIVPTLSGPAIGNYSVSATNGILSIFLANSTTSLSVASATVAYGSPVVIQANVLSSTTGTPTGTVTFLDGTTPIGTSALTSGVATFTATGLLLGVHNLIAIYSGDYDFYGSSATQTSISVVSASYTITPTATSLALSGSQSVTDLLSITAVGGYSGTIAFSCANLPAGLQCGFTPSALTIGSGVTSPSTTLSISRTSNQALLIGHGQLGIELAETGFGSIVLLLFIKRRKMKNHRNMCLLCSLTLLTVTLVLTGCAGGNTNPPTYTPSGSYQILIQANASTGSSSTVPITVVVQ